MNFNLELLEVKAIVVSCGMVRLENGMQESMVGSTSQDRLPVLNLEG